MAALMGASLTVACAPIAAPAAAPRPALLPSGDFTSAVNGVRLHYRIAGQTQSGRAPILFLHGGPGGNPYSFAVTAGALLERDWPVIYLDQRGSGGSERPSTGDYAIATVANDVEALRQHLGVPQWAILAHSFGTTIALDYAARYPAQVAALVIAGGLADAPESCRETVTRLRDLRPAAFAKAFPDGTAAVPDKEICQRAFGALPGRAGEAYRDLNMFASAADLARFQKIEAASGIRNTGEMGNYQFRNGLLEYRFDRFSAVTSPVLVISGLHDWAAGPESQRKLARRLPRGSIVEYPDAGHWSFVDAPERFARDVTEFLRRN